MSGECDFVFFDTETTSTYADAGILSVGIVAVNSKEEYTFDELAERGREWKFDIREQIRELNRHVETSTMVWWKKQVEAAQRVLKPLPSDYSIKKLHDLMLSYLSEMNVSHKAFWVQRGDMDFNVIKDLYRKLGMDGTLLPWQFWNFEDSRTAIRHATGLTRGKFNVDDDLLAGAEVVEHNALHDACLDVLRYQMMGYHPSNGG